MPLYNGSKLIDQQRAIEKLKFLIKHQKIFELTEKKKTRSISQNSYLHLIFSWVALETGYTSAEVKQEIFKKIVNPNTFYEGEKEKIPGVKIEQWRSTADLKTDEMNLCIDRFRDYCNIEAGIYIPEPRELAYLDEIKFKINDNKEFL